MPSNNRAVLSCYESLDLTCLFASIYLAFTWLIPALFEPFCSVFGQACLKSVNSAYVQSARLRP